MEGLKYEVIHLKKNKIKEEENIRPSISKCDYNINCVLFYHSVAYVEHDEQHLRVTHSHPHFFYQTQCTCLFIVPIFQLCADLFDPFAESLL